MSRKSNWSLVEMNKKKICIIINVDWFALSHFKHYFTTLVDAGHDVTVVTSCSGKTQELSNLGVTVMKLEIYRGYKSLISEVKQFRSLYSLLNGLNPDVLELITIKPMIYGALCAKILRLKNVVFYVSGLGSQFLVPNIFGNFKRKFMLFIYRFLMKGDGKFVIVENETDQRLFSDRVKIAESRLIKLGGVGVSIREFTPRKTINKERIDVGMATRLLHDKGVIEYFYSARILSEAFKSVQFHLAGKIDPTNPRSLSEVELEEIRNSGLIKLHGHLDNIDIFLQSLDIFVLPSYREGFPRAIMEASATGLPIVTTDVPGCRDSVIHNQTGLLCDARDPVGLTKCIETLLKDSALRKKLGKGGRQYALENFDEEFISKSHKQVLEVASAKSN